MRMSWITKHWDQEYADRAEDIIKDLVGHLLGQRDHSH